MKKFLVILMFFLIIFSCDSSKPVRESNVKTYRINLQKAVNIRLDAIFQNNVEYIVLDDSLAILKDINKIVFSDLSIFILDQDQQNILRFSKKGKLLNYCGRKGKGPGEVFYPSDILYKDHKLYVLNGNRKMLVFDTLGTFQNDIKLPMQALSFTFNDEILYLYRGYHSDLKENFRLYSMDGNEIDKYLKVDISEAIPPVDISSKNFNQVQGAIRLHEPLNNTIYKIENKIVSPLYKIDFGEYNLPKEVLGSKDQFKLLKTLNSGKYAQITSWLENDNYLMFKFHLEQNGYYFIQNKRSGKSFLANGFKNDINYFPFGEPIALTSDNELIMKTEAFRILNRREHLLKKEVVSSEKMDGIYELSQNLTKLSNPVIFIYKIDF